MKTTLFFIGIVFLLLTEFFKIYYIMPFPGSQQSTALDVSYTFHTYAWYFRIGGLLLILPFLIHLFPKKRWWAKLLFLVPVALYGWFFYLCNFDFLADKMFSVIGKKIMATSKENKMPLTKLIIGVKHNGESRAYPIEVIGYHHQILDTVGGLPVIATYCTVCRTGRVYKSSIDGKQETFRLVGMDQFNAMFEDASTGSWWQQATGVCVKGPQKGKKMEELFSQQMSLQEWIKENPNTRILQGDNDFNWGYEELMNYDNGTIKSSLEGRDSGSWKPKSWIIGVLFKNDATAIDWNDLEKLKCIQTSNFVALMLNDKTNFFVYSNSLNNTTLKFNYNTQTQQLVDIASGSVFNYNGTCVEGVLLGTKLTSIPAYQEFWHSWQTFHPTSTTFKP